LLGFFFTNGVRMRFNVSHLVKAPIGVRDVIHLDVGPLTLGDDLFLHHLQGDIWLTRTTDGLLAEGRLDVSLDAECIRCLALFPLPLQVILDDLTFALPQASSEGDGDGFRISENGQLDTMPALREQIMLSIPPYSQCRSDCRGLCSQCGQDLNSAACDCEAGIIDPRLTALRDLL
jgi:uncharacterized protein